MTPVRLVTMQRLASLLLFAGLSGTATAAINGLGVEPMRLELEGLPGQSKTASFVIDAPPSDEQNPVRGRILVRLADWSLDEDASVSYHEPGTLPASAARWITYSPSDFGVSSGQRRAVRVTAEIPLGTLPGVYTAALFVEERSPSESVSSGEYRFLFRFRYVVTVYVVVPPVTRQGELVNIELQEAEGGSRRLVASLKNIGGRHLRPSLAWFVRSNGVGLVDEHQAEGTVLLPGAVLHETRSLTEAMPAGVYEIEVQADFHDGRPVQAVRRRIEIRNDRAN